jgi:hypothetical protein
MEPHPQPGPESVAIARELTLIISDPIKSGFIIAKFLLCFVFPVIGVPSIETLSMNCQHIIGGFFINGASIALGGAFVVKG